jgi:hypothetical protein
VNSSRPTEVTVMRWTAPERHQCAMLLAVETWS